MRSLEIFCCISVIWSVRNHNAYKHLLKSFSCACKPFIRHADYHFFRLCVSIINTGSVWANKVLWQKIQNLTASVGSFIGHAFIDICYAVLVLYVLLYMVPYIVICIVLYIVWYCSWVVCIWRILFQWHFHKTLDSMLNNMPTVHPVTKRLYFISISLSSPNN